MSETIAQILTPDQVQRILSALGIPWEDYQPDEDGWINLPDVGYFEGDIGVNINHGGFVDHFANGRGDPEHSGDIVQLAARVKFHDDIPEAIHWVQKLLGIGPPEPDKDQMFAKDWIAKDVGNYAMIPEVVWKSRELSASAKIVWIAIYDRCGKGKYCSWAGINTIAEDTNLSRSTVQRSISELRNKNFLIESEIKNGLAPKRYPVTKDPP